MRSSWLSPGRRTPDAGRSHIVVVPDRSRAIVNSSPLIGVSRTLRSPVSIDGPASLTVEIHVIFRDGGETRGHLMFAVGAPAQAVAMLVAPVARSAPVVALRRAAMAPGPLPVRSWQPVFVVGAVADPVIWFSMCQWRRIHA